MTLKYQSFPEPSVTANPENKDQGNKNDDLEEEYELLTWCGIRRSNVLLMFYVLSYFFYLILGGYVMSLLETPYEESLKAQTKNLKEQFLRNNPLINSKKMPTYFVQVTQIDISVRTILQKQSFCKVA